MRRDILLSLIGVCAGFALAALIFWSPTSATVGSAKGVTLTPVVENSEASATGHPQGSARIGVPVVVAPEPRADDATPQTPAGLFHEALAALPDMEPGSRDKAVADLISKLRAQGPAGLQAVREFFATGNDVTLRNGWGMSNGRITSAPSLRIALLEGLSDWPGGLEVNREIARMTSRPFEAAIAIRNLEKAAPGVYRAEAIRTMQELANQPVKGEYAMEGANYVIETMRHFNAPELIPAAEQVVRSQPYAAHSLIHAVAEMPEAVADPVIDRLFAEPRVTDQFASNPHVFRNLPFDNTRVVGNAAQLFATRMTAKQQDRFLADFGSGRGYTLKSDFFAQQGAEVQKPSAVISKVLKDSGDIEGRLNFLEAIEPAATTPVLQQRVAEARDELKKALDDPQEVGAEAKIEQTIIIGNGIGDAVIQGRKIQDIQIRIDR